MLQEIWQEITKLQKDKLFLHNLTIVGIIAVSFFLILAEEYHHPAKITQQEKLTRFSTLVSAGMVIKTYESLPN